MNTREIGTICEVYVCEQLIRQGYHLLARNFRVGKGAELDIVAQKGEIIHFIEVKARSGTGYGLPREAVSPQKIRHIIRASEQFTALYHTHGAKRSYDVAEVYFSRSNEAEIRIQKMELLENVF